MRRDCGHRSRSDVGAKRVEAAMGDVENLQYAEYQRQPQCNDEKPGSLNQPVDNDGQKEVHCVVFMRGGARRYNSQPRLKCNTWRSHIAKREDGSGASLSLTPRVRSLG